MAETLYNEPTSFYAGDTVTWLKAVDDYPATGYTLYYAFRNATSKFNVTCTASGDEHLATITAAESGVLTPGRYDFAGYVRNGSGEQHTVSDGWLQVLPNLSANVNYDARSEARQIYDELLAAYKAYISSNGTMQAFTVGGKSVSYKSAADIIQQLSHWERIVRQEEDAAAVAKGYPNPRRVGIRLTRL